MNAASWVILGLLALLLALALRTLLRRRGGCGCGCSGCTKNCKTGDRYHE